MGNILLPLRFLLLSFLLPSSLCFSQVTDQWVKRNNAMFRAMTVDVAGNVYVTASSWSIAENLSDYVTVKYHTDGKEIWTKRYNDPYSSSDVPTAIAVDPSGNVYVTGSSNNGGTGVDYTTIKYDGGGKELWIKHYNGTGDDYDNPVAILVDASGSVYVTGSSTGSGTLTDFATVKYDAEGNELWSKRYNGPANEYQFDAALAIAVDASGNVYVTGYSRSAEGDDDYATIKYDAQGNELWVKRHNGTGSGSDVPRSIAIDAADNVYVTGVSYSGLNSGLTQYDWDWGTIKYDTQGNELWVRSYNGTGDDYDDPIAILVDASGNVYITGSSTGIGTLLDFATVKYDTEGNVLWSKRYNGTGNGFDDARAIALDHLGNVYVTGTSFGGELDEDFATIKYDNNGNERWTIVSYNGPDDFDDLARNLALDAAGNVYVAGESYTNNGQDYAVIKYVQAAPLIVVAGADKTLYLGYDPACVSLSATVSGGTAPYSYSWSAQSGNTPSISVCPGATTTYVVTVTDAAGQQVTDDVLINVIDVRCGNNNKVLVCHKGKTLCISAKGVAEHLDHGDKLASCANERTTAENSRLVSNSKTGEKKITGANKLKVHVAPNPVQHSTRIYYELAVDGEVEIRILDAVGRVVSNLEKAYRKAGSYNREWNTRSLGKAVYYYQVFFTAKGEATVETGKLLVLK